MPAKRISGAKRGVKPSLDIDILDKALNTDYWFAVQSARDSVFGHPAFTGVSTEDPLDITDDDTSSPNFKVRGQLENNFLSQLRQWLFCFQ